MDRANTAIDKLERIQQLWAELSRTKLNSPEYKALAEKIRTLSAEYQSLANNSKEPESRN
jgi:hypothetical protein